MNAYPVLKLNGKWRGRIDGHVIHTSESAVQCRGYDENEVAALAAVLSYAIFSHDGLTPAEELELGLSRQREWAKKKAKAQFANRAVRWNIPVAV